MGQRTTIILQHVRDCDKETRVFYNRWGIGRIMPANFLNILNSVLSVGSSYYDDYLERLKPNGTSDITNEYEGDRLENLENVDFDAPEIVGNVMRHADNNNGGIFIRLTSEDYAVKKIEFAFMLGCEEDGDYKRFCTPDEWMKKAGFNYCDEDFKAIFYNTLKYFEAIDRSK